MDSHWFSYSTYVSSGVTSPGDACMLSVVFEEDANRHFSGIRLLVLYKPSERLNTLSVEECHDPTTFRAQPGIRPSHRQVLARRSTAIKCSKNVLIDATRPVCTLVFELVDTSDDWYHCLALVPRSPSEVEHLDHIRVAFDLAYPYNSSNVFVPLVLKFSHSFHRVPKVAGSPGVITDAQSRLGMDVHSIRVLPVIRRQRKYISLPPQVLRHIIKLSLGGKPKGWRNALLSFGLVCKSWTHVLDLAIGGFDEVEDEDRPGVLSVARVLRARPERGAAIRIFNPWIYEYYIDASDQASLGKWQAILDILTYATSAESVHLSSIHASIARDFIRLLKQLRRVRHCKMKFGSAKTRSRFPRGHAFSIHEVQTFIADWEQLETLELVNWRDPNPDPEAPSLSQLTCGIKDLSLQGGKLTGPQLMLFTPRPTSYLKVLSLFNVQDLPNRDFVSFLNAVAPTLSRLFVVECIIHRATLDEERAIDVAMPAMIALEHLLTDGNCVSAHAIARKAPARSRPDDCVRGSIVIQAANLGMALEDVAKAMKVTTWGTVDVLWEGAPRWDEALAEKTRQVARERGVTFECRVKRR